MKYVITEEQSNIIKLVRRLSLIDENMIKNCLISFENICRNPVNILIMDVGNFIVEYFYHTVFSDLEAGNKFWNQVHDIVYEYIKKNHYDFIKNHYDKICQRQR